jgi:undecaprenyl-diphosphatase
MELIGQWDAAILLWIQKLLRNDTMTTFWRMVTWLGDGGKIWILSAVILLIPKKTRQTGLLALLSLLICNIATNNIFKHVFARPRPFQIIDTLVPLIKKPVSYSFPSGHTSSSFSAAWVYYKKLPGKYGIPAMILAGMIAFSRIYLGVHYPSDILGGILLAYIVSTAVGHIELKEQL